MRLISYLFFFLAIGALGLDYISAPEGGEFTLRSLGETWFRLDRDSWLQLQPAIERHIHPDLWFGAVEPVTRQPAVLLFAGIGAVFFVLSLLFGRRSA